MITVHEVEMRTQGSERENAVESVSRQNHGSLSVSLLTCCHYSFCGRIRNIFLHLLSMHKLIF